MRQVIYDPFDRETHENPYPVYKVLRDEFPVYYNEQYDFWVLSRYEDVAAADRDWKTFSPMYGVDLDDTTDYFGEGTPAAGFFLGYDPPRHDNVRRIFQKTFLPKGLEPVEGMIQQKVDELVAGFVDRGKADLAEEFAAPLPNDMTAEMLGFPRSEQPRLTELLETFIARDPGDTGTIPQEGLEAAAELKARCARILEQRRRAEGQDDLIGDMLDAKIESEPLPEDEIVGIMFFLFTAGADTVKGLLTNALWLLERYPDQRARLVENPSGIPNAIEEILRFEAPLPLMRRTAMRQVELHGQVIPEGATVVLLFASANRDEREFEDPDRFDITREISRHATFGGGLHRCMGAPLARMEAKLALQTLVPQVPDYSISEPVKWIDKVNIRGLEKLPVTF